MDEKQHYWLLHPILKDYYLTTEAIPEGRIFAIPQSRQWREWTWRVRRTAFKRNIWSRNKIEYYTEIQCIILQLQGNIIHQMNRFEFNQISIVLILHCEELKPGKLHAMNLLLQYWCLLQQVAGSFNSPVLKRPLLTPWERFKAYDFKS